MLYYVIFDRSPGCGRNGISENTEYKPIRGDMRIHARTLKFAAPLALLLVLGAMAPMSSAVAAPKAAASGAPVTFGAIVSETNPATPGSKNTASRDTLNAWVKMVNAAGGVNGHKVTAKIVDDGTDPAKASSIMKSLIDSGVVAIVGSGGNPTEAVWRPIADAAGVPIVGGPCYTNDANGDENYFCVTTNAILDGLKAQVKLAAEQGGKSFGISYASDIPAAAAAAPLFKSLAVATGMTYTESVGTTATQPDYTAACVTLKQANTTDVGIEGGALLQNLARDCGRQAYFPKYTSGDGQISQNAWVKDPNIKEAIAAVYSFPYMLTKGNDPTQTASLKEYHKAMDKYAPDVLKGDSKQPSTHIWTAAKAFQKALESTTAANPTAADIKAGMYTFKDETLGGLTPNPITFTQGQDHAHNSCWYFIQLKNHKMTAPDGMKTTCTP